jgi:hypothetical protein
MDTVQDRSSTQSGTPDSWLDSLLHQASLTAPEQTLPLPDDDFTARVIVALPARSTVGSLSRILPLAAVLLSVSAGLWCLLFGQFSLALNRHNTLWLQILPMAILYWVCWETCFVGPRSAR